MAAPSSTFRDRDFPPLPFEDWKDTQETLHRWLQIVGKTRMALAPMENHWWQVTLYVTPRGLTTSPMPAAGGSLAIDFDFLGHTLDLRTSRGETIQMALGSRTVAEFFRDVMASLRQLGVALEINQTPQEIVGDLTAFGADTHHRTYDPAAVERWFRAMVQVDLALRAFRAPFTGKSSPVHFFWGSADLALTRFSGRTAPSRRSEGPVVAEAYSDEVFSAGFWHGTPELGEAAVYAYAVPEPRGFSTSAQDLPEGATYSEALGEYVMPWSRVCAAEDPRRVMQTFLHTTYEAAARLGRWDRGRLERAFLAEPPSPEEDAADDSPPHAPSPPTP